MSLEVDSLEIVANTVDGKYGVNIPFSRGLFLLSLKNTHGKSTCMNAIAYALGMEKALGIGGSSTPFPPSLTRALETVDGKELKVLSSYVILKIKNKNGDLATINRSIVGARDNNVLNVSVVDIIGDVVNEGEYFVHRVGDSSRELGFYKWLSDFLNWELPQVPNYNGNNTTLYPAVLFPTWFVEQKKGWSSIMATIPTMLGIKDAKKRAIEFILSLDVNDSLILRHNIKNEIDSLSNQWHILKCNIDLVASKLSAIVSGVPENPVSKFDCYKIDLSISEGENIKSIVKLKEDLESELEIVNKNFSRKIGDREASLDAIEKINKNVEEIQTLEWQLQDLNDKKGYIGYQILSTNKVIENLLEDKRKYEDLKKIVDADIFSSSRLFNGECPTCGGSYNDNLLESESNKLLMTYEESLNFIKDQIKAFEFIASDCDEKIRLKDAEISNISDKIAELKYETIKLKGMGRPSFTIQEEYLRKKLLLEYKIEELKNAIAEIESIKLEFDLLHRKYLKVVKERKNLPNRILSDKDERKLTLLQKSLIARLKKYEFSSFGAEKITISKDNYLPTREGYDIGFDTSASDGIRIIWGYMISLFSVGLKYDTNHPGVVIFDEPRQQETNIISFSSLLKDAACAVKDKGQIIFATSESVSDLEIALDGCDYKIYSIDDDNGKLIRKL